MTPAPNFRILSYLLDLGGFKIKHHPTGILGIATHFGVVQEGKVETTKIPAVETVLAIDHIGWLTQQFFIKGCLLLEPLRSDHYRIKF
jgi:hypothetical protein